MNLKEKLTQKKSIVWMLIIVLVAVAYVYLQSTGILTVENILSLSKKVEPTTLTLSIFLGIYFLGGALFVATPLIAFGASLVFPLWIALILNLVGVTLASLSGYLLGKIIPKKYFPDFIVNHIDEAQDFLDQKGFWAVFAFRLAPTPPFTASSILWGILGYSWWKYTVATVLGILPLTALTQVFGKTALTAMKNPSLILGLLVVAVLILIVLVKSVDFEKVKKRV